jgi:hypothetical protein
VQVTDNVKPVFVTLRRGVAVLLLIVVATLVGIYSKEIALLLALYRYEGGAIAFTSGPRTPHFVGSVRGASLPRDFQVLADNGNMRIAAALYRNGCFSLEGSASRARFGIYAPGFKSIGAEVDAGYFSVLLTPSPLASSSSGEVSFTPISVWECVRKTVACTTSPI